MWLSGLGVVPQTERSLVGFPVRAHAWVVGQVLVGGIQEATNQRFSQTWMFLSLSFSFPPPSLKISNLIFKNLKKKSWCTFCLLTESQLIQKQNSSKDVAVVTEDSSMFAALSTTMCLACLLEDSVSLGR